MLLLIAPFSVLAASAPSGVMQPGSAMQASAGMPEIDQINYVNQYYNRVRFVSDAEHWGRDDYWATPREFLASKGGDCEDFTIAKYFTLKALGVPEARLRMTYVNSRALGQPHMVLGYYATPESEPVFLDNLVGEVLPASKRTDLEPIYSFNADGLWLSSGSVQGVWVGDVSRVSQWKELNARMKQDLF